MININKIIDDPTIIKTFHQNSIKLKKSPQYTN